MFPLSKVSSYVEEKPWTPYSASSLPERWVHSQWIALHGGNTDFWVAARDHWVSQCVGQGLVFRRSSSSSPRTWYLCCGALNSLVVLGVRLATFAKGGTNYIAFDRLDGQELSSPSGMQCLKCSICPL